MSSQWVLLIKKKLFISFKEMKQVPRLDVTTLKVLNSIMKRDKDFSILVQSNPYIKNLIETTEKNIISRVHQDLYKKQTSDFNFLFLRYMHLQLIQALLILFKHDPDSIVELSFPRWKMEMTSFLDDQHHNVYHLKKLNRKNILLKEHIFWNQHQLVKYMIDTLLDTFPRRVKVYHSIITLNFSPVYIFVRSVQDTLEPVHSKKLIPLYNKRYADVFREKE